MESQEKIQTILTKIWDNEPDVKESRLLGEVYCTILLSGKDDGEYSDRDLAILESVVNTFPPEFIKILDTVLD